MKATNKEGVTKIHNVRFYNLTPRTINCLAYNKGNGKLAVSRNDASLEIWDINHAPILEKTIPGNLEASIEAISWVGDRLFSTGLSCEITEWDLIHLKKKHSQLVTGNAVWCLDISRQEDCLALGTEDGYLNLFEIVEDGLMYKLLFDKQEGRILCCKFDGSGDFIVTGSMDVIRIWNAKTGNAIHKMTLGRNEAKRETIVWSLQVLSDFSIISGDSRGCITVWDGKIGSQVQSIQASKVDILTTTINENEDTIAVSGIDPLIKIFTLTSIKKEEQSAKMWVKFLQRNIHDHDVKALACAGTRIISGGLDGYLGITSYSKYNLGHNKYGPFLQSPCASVSSEGRLVLLRYPNFLELWRLGISEKNKIQIADDENDSRKLLMLEEAPEKLMELRSYNDKAIVCSSISPNGRILMYSTMEAIRVLLITQKNEKETFKLTRIKDLPEQFNACHQIIFSSDSETVFLIKLNRHIDVFRILSNNEIDYLETIDVSKSIKDVINLSTISPCGKYLIVVDVCRTISVWKKISTKKGWQHYMNLPKYFAPTTAIAVHYNRPRIVATFSDGKIFEYDLEEMHFTCSTNKMFIPKMNIHCINGIVLDPRNENAIILHNDTYLFVLLKDEDTSNPTNKLNKSSKISNTDETLASATAAATTTTTTAAVTSENSSCSSSSRVAKLKLKFTKTYEHFVHLAWLTEEELIAINVNPITLIEQLSTTFRRKKFGDS